MSGDPLLLQVLMLLLTVVVLPLAGIITAGGAVALCCDLFGRRNDSAAHRRLAAALLERLVPGHGVWLLLPLGLALALLCQWLVYAPPQALLPWWGAALALLLAGSGALRITRYTLSRGSLPVLLVGGAGVLMNAAALYLFTLSEGLLQRPDQLVLLPRIPEIIVSWYATWRFLSFAALSAAAAGAVLRWGGERWTAEVDPGRHGGAFLLGCGALLLPPLIFLEIVRIPPYALSSLLLALAAVAIVQSALVFLLLASGGGRRRLALTVTLLIFPVWIAMGHLGREEAQSGFVVAGTAALLDFPTLGAPAVAAPTPPAPPGIDGEAVFKRVCSACHQFDRRVVGPPLNEVVPKYGGDVQALMSFIRDPVRVNPEYPPMPRLGLSEGEIEAVATWLLQEVEE